MLFRPVITTSHSPLLECDFNGHKSNSTFYSDLDVSRLDLLCILFKDVMLSANAKTRTERGFKRVSPFLGGVSCTFRKEIKPYQKYEIWSRVISWDNKWIYVASHFVVPGKVRIPQGYALSGRAGTRLGGKYDDKPQGTSLLKQCTQANGATKSFAVSEDVMQGAVIASAISRYVFKEGRKSIPPAAVFRAMDLPVLETIGAEDLPANTVALPTACAEGANDATASTMTDINAKVELCQPKGAVRPEEGREWGHGCGRGWGLKSFEDEARGANANAGENGGSAARTQPRQPVVEPHSELRWDWNRVELERLRGLKMANNLTDLGGLSLFLT
jgi:hypothetical protein